MHYQLPTLEHECITALLQHSNYVKAALQQVLSLELRAQITRRVILCGKVTAMRTALQTWPEETLAVGDLCCRERVLFDHGWDAPVEELVPQVLQFSLGRVRRPPPPAPLASAPDGAPLSVVFIAARFLEMSLSQRPGHLRHLDLTYYGMVTLIEMEPVIGALLEIHRADEEAGRTVAHPFTLSLSLAVTDECDDPRLHVATSRLDRFLLMQTQQPARRCLLRITGLFSGEASLQKTARRVLRVIALRQCPLEVLIANGTADWGRGEQGALVQQFDGLRLLGTGACDSLLGPRLETPAGMLPIAAPVLPVHPGVPTEVRRQRHVRGLVLSGCRNLQILRIKNACKPSGPLLSLSVSRSLIGIFTPEDLLSVRRLSIVSGHGSAASRPQMIDNFLNWLPRLVNLQLLTLDELFCETQLCALAAALPQLTDLRFCRVPTAADRPLDAMESLCVGARLAPMLRAIHVKLVRAPELDAWRPLSEVTENLRDRIGPPTRENVGFYVTERAPVLSGLPDELQYMPL